VTVAGEQVNVERAKVDVERQSLSNKQEFEGAALKFELEKFRIAAEKEIRIAAANAMGQMLAKANMQIFGDPDTMARMSARFMQAASYGTAVDGLMSTLPPETRDLLDKLGSIAGMKLAGTLDGAPVVPPIPRTDGKPAPKA
jgi:flotillin